MQLFQKKAKKYHNINKMILSKHQGRKLIFNLLLIVLVFLTTSSIAQPKVPKPQFNNFHPVSSQSSQSKSQTLNLQQSNDPISGTNIPLGATANDILRQTQQQAMRQMGVPAPRQSNNNYRQNQLADLNELKKEEAEDEYGNNLTQFQTYYNQLLQLNPDKFSITQAVYLTEAAYYDKPAPYNVFLRAIQERANVVKQLLKQENMSLKNSSAVHYAIQKMFSQNNTLLHYNAGKTVTVKKISYDFDDFDAEKDWTKMFVTKLLQTNSGQCHSLPLLYLCIAEQLNTKAWLSLAPEHSFIQFIDGKGKLANFETTNGHLVTLTWLLQCNAISTIALKNRTYLDSLSSKKLFAQCLEDLQMGYLSKNGYDFFTDEINRKVLLLDSSNLGALMYLYNLELLKFRELLKKYALKSQQQIDANPVLSAAQKQMVAAQHKVTNRGYQDMPNEQYLQWLQSIEYEKKKQKLKTK